MRFAGKSRRVGWFLCGICASTLCLLMAACGKIPGPTEPDDGQPRSYLGTWSGTIASSAIGPGLIAIVFQTQIAAPNTSLLSGVWTLTFADTRFSTTGAATAVLTPDSLFGIAFDRHTVPCPEEPSGVAERTMFASMTVVEDRMRGHYIAGGCPGGTIELMKQ